MKHEENSQPAVLLLEDGKTYSGYTMGASLYQPVLGEVVFNTSMSGYQEIITDPSYRGQIVVFTYPSIGNYGTNSQDNEALFPWLEAIIIKDYSPYPSNFRSEKPLNEFLSDFDKVGLVGLDTRALVRHIREFGALKAGIFLQVQIEDKGIDECLKLVKSHPDMSGQNLTDVFTGEAANAFVKRYAEEKQIKTASLPQIAVLDFGIKWSILANFLDRGLHPVVFPGSKPIKEWENFKPDHYVGYFLSNGPGDPASVEEGINNIREILSQNRPTLGICLGHQMISLALGAQTYKMKFGHHGGNQPVRTDKRKNILITAQNHGFAVDDASLHKAIADAIGSGYETNPNDHSSEGFYINSKDYNLMSVQYHPEASPGPHDAQQIFDEFLQRLNLEETS